jgi:hypothetical protein
MNLLREQAVIRKSCFFIGVFLYLNIFSFDSISKNLSSIKFLVSSACLGAIGYKSFNLYNLINSKLEKESFDYENLCSSFVRKNVTITSYNDDERQLFTKNSESLSCKARAKSFINVIGSITAFATTLYAINFGKNIPYKRIILFCAAPVWLFLGPDAPVKKYSWMFPFDKLSEKF